VKNEKTLPKPKEFMTLAKALKQSREQIKENHHAYLNTSLTSLIELLKFDKHFVRAEGVSVWDAEGNEYLDCLGGYGSLNLGHNHPHVLAALEKVKHLPNLLQVSLGALPAALARSLAAATPGNLCRSFFGNSGTEAVEGALKLARASTGRADLVYCEGSFHGKTMGALSVTGREKYQKTFLPLIPGCRKVPFGDLTALEYVLKEQTAAAFIVEPILGEGGIVVPPPGYLAGAGKICSKFGTLFILDEIQTGLGRTGTLFACEHEGVVPDVMCLSKSLGGGIMPISAYITTDPVWKKAYGSMDKATLHTTTFGGNTLATAAALAALEVIYNENLPARAKESGEYLLAGLKRLKEKYPLIKEVRGRGLLVGVEFEQPGGLAAKASFGLINKLSDEYLGSMVAGELLNKHRIITAYTLNNPNVIRLEPPLVITRGQLDTLLAALEQIFSTHKGFMGFAASSAKTILSRFTKK
jgi:putrescine aminotransferase